MPVAITEFRRQLGRYVRQVETGAGPVTIVAHGKTVAALVSLEQLQMIWMAEDEMLKGPRDVRSGVRPGAHMWRRMRSWISRDGWEYVTEREKAELKAEDEEAAALRAWRDKHADH